ncbi:hypothetical protein DSO57_1035976 [Entomophthora muscae]|uniref:Uncharacterized protein n=1 Tax=Entomophthora muscae TaxID=34485 RepID=A0ACC2S1A4_9FUNG|nr:hypothetical protein DSO57_1035976 [Entomophthora muscae]
MFSPFSSPRALDQKLVPAPPLPVRNIPDTYSCVTNIQTPAVTEQTSAITVKTPAATTQKPTTIKLLTAVNVQASAANKQIHTTTTQKPSTTKLLPAANAQTPAITKQMSTAIEQMHSATVQAPATLASPTYKPSVNQALMSQPATYQPLPSHVIRPVPIHSFGK